MLNNTPNKKLMLKKVKAYKQIKDSGHDELLGLMIDDTACAVLNYCHIKKLCPSLESVVVQVVMRKFKEIEGGGVSSLKMGDVSISYSNSVDVNGFTAAEKTVLNAHRKVVIG